MRYLKAILYLIFLSGLVACGSKSAQDVKQGAQNILNANGNAAIENATYASACTSSTLPNIGSIKFPGTKTIYKLSNLTFSKTQVYYTDGDCKDEAIIVTEMGKVAVQGTPQKDQPLQEDFNFEKTSVKLQTEVLVKAFNLFKLCGFSDNQWTLGGELYVSTESNQATCPGKPSPRTAQELVLVKDGTLYLGADANNTIRPDRVDLSKPYLKQP